MKIAFFSFALAGRGGMENVLRLVSVEMRKLGHQCTFLFSEQATRYQDWDKVLGDVKYVSRRAFGVHERYPGENPIISLMLDMQAVLRRLERPDVILCLAPWAIPIAKVASAIYGETPPIIVSWLHNSLHLWPERDVIRYADAHLAISSGLRNQIQSIDPGKPVSLVYNPVCVENNTVIPRASIPTFVYVGRIDIQQKRLDNILQALGLIADLDWRFKVIGAPVLDSQDVLKRLQDQAYTLGISERIEWTGWREDPWSCLEEATALILASEWEGFGLVLAEALSRGLPVVSSDCPVGPSDIVQNGVNGWLFPPGDVQALASILRKIAESGDDFLPSPSACIKSVERFSAKRVVPHMALTLEHYVTHLSSH